MASRMCRRLFRKCSWITLFALLAAACAPDQDPPPDASEIKALPAPSTDDDGSGAAPDAASDAASDTASEAPFKVRVVVLVNFEIGADTGDQPGEFQLWYTRGIDGHAQLDCVPLPQSTHAACLDREDGVLVTYTGLSADRAAASVMAMGMDPRFDFTQAYWLIGGIAGIDPQDGSLGSAVWAHWVVNGDWAHEIDAREMPADWQTGYLPFGRHEPYAQPVGDDYGKVYHLNEKLSDWAFALTRSVQIPDNPDIARRRAEYTDTPAAQTPPHVMQGDNVSASTFWHGELLNQWANDWMKYWTHGQGEFVTTAVEDSGILEAVRFLDAGGKARFNRVMLLRTASNYSMQPPGMTAAESLSRESDGFSGLDVAVNAHWRVGSTVVRELAYHWDQYADQIPVASPIQAAGADAGSETSEAGGSGDETQ